MVIVARQFISRIRGDTAPRQRHSQSRKPHRFRKKVADSGLNMEGKRGGFQSDRKKYRRFTWKRESKGFPLRCLTITMTDLHSNSRSQRLKRRWLLVTTRFSSNSLNARLRTLCANSRVTCVPHTPTPVRQWMSGRSCKRTGPPYPCAVARWRRGCLFPMSRSL